MKYNNHPSCVCPPSPELEEKISKTRQLIKSGASLVPSNDLLSIQDYSAIIGRPKKTRAHTFEKTPSKISSIGQLKALVILVDFPDNQSSQNKNHYSDMLFSSGTYQNGSMHDYFAECSYGKLNVTGDVFGWYRMPQNYAYYVDGQNGFGNYPNNVQKLVQDAVFAANTDVNFSDYDLDGDGIVDALFIIHAGTGAEVTGNANQIWSHRWSIPPVTLDGIKIVDYTMEPEDGKIGVFSHELTHVFNVPDLYDTDNSSSGVGKWCLMAAGSWLSGGTVPAHPCAWVKQKLGWVNPINPQADAIGATLPDVESNEKIMKLWTGGANNDEYFLLEYRKKKGFDANLPNEGLLIYHIDDAKTSNSDEGHYLVGVEQADGKQDLETKSNSGDTGDPFPGSQNNTSFDATSNPNSNSYAGADTKVSVTNISLAADKVTFDFSVGVGIVSTIPQVVSDFLANRVKIKNISTGDILANYKMIGTIPDKFAQQQGIMNQALTTVGYEDRYGRPESDGDFIDVLLEISHTPTKVNSARGIQLGGDDIEVFVDNTSTGMIPKTKEIPL